MTIIIKAFHVRIMMHLKRPRYARLFLLVTNRQLFLDLVDEALLAFTVSR